MATTPTAATATSLADEANKKAQEDLRLKKLQEDALLGGYSVGSKGIYDSAKTNSSDILGAYKTDVTGLYDQGYKDLQANIKQQSDAAMNDSIRPIEGKLNSQGLLGGPSGALNEALAGAAQRVQTAGLEKLSDYNSQKVSALASAYGLNAQQLSQLEQTYGTQTQGLLATALQQKLATNNQSTDTSQKFAQTGLEAALGTNKMVLEQAGQKDVLAEQATLNQNAVDAANATKNSELKTKQQTYDVNLSALTQQLYSLYRSQGSMDAAATQAARADALKQLGPRP